MSHNVTFGAIQGLTNAASPIRINGLDHCWSIRVVYWFHEDLEDMRHLIGLGALAVLVFAMVSPAAGEPGNITGKVLDGKTKEPLPFSNVVIVGTPYGAMTMQDGSTPTWYRIVMPDTRFSCAVQQQEDISIGSNF